MAWDDVLHRWPNLLEVMLAASLLASANLPGLAMPPQSAGVPPSAVRSSAAAREGLAFPPLYRRILNPEAAAGTGISMIAGVGDLNHAPAPLPSQRFRRPSLQPACAVPPAPNTLRSFAVFQWMTKQEASALGLAVASASDPADAVRLPNVLVWRSGRIAECESTGRAVRVLYGSEWDVGLLVQERDAGTKPSTFTALQRAAPPRPILAFVSSTSGLAKNAALLRAFHNLASDIETSRSAGLTGRFLEDFAQARAAGDAAIQQAGALEPIGYIAN